MEKTTRLLKSLGFYIFSIIGILLFSALPALFRFSPMDDSLFKFKEYFNTVKQVIIDLFEPDTWVYQVQYQTYSILENIKEPYIYSMKIFGSSILIAFTIAFFVTFIILLMPKKTRKVLMGFFAFVESIPDLVVAFGSVLFIVFLYKKTGILFFNFVTLSKEEQIYFLPILALTILPTIYFIKVMVTSCEEELDKNYVELARSKGLTNSFIVLIHVFRNISESLYYQSKTIIWFTLSNMMIIEYLFNIKGIVFFIQQAGDPKATFLTLVLIFTPFYLLFSIVELFVTRKSEESEDEIWKNIKRPAFISGTIKFIFKTVWRILRPIFIQFKSVKFVIGFVVIAGIFSFSLYHYYEMDSKIPQTVLLYEGDELIDAPPLPPSEKHWFGTDRLGYDMFYKVVDGAKYTLTFAILIAFLRIFFSSFLGIFYAFYVKGRVRRAIEKFVEGYHYLPVSLIALILLAPILRMPPDGFSTTHTERIVLEVAILTILALPVVSVLLGSEIKMILNEEYITSTKVLGASKMHVMWKHIRIHLGPKLGIIMGQQIVQVLLLFTHLGLFQLFFGGTEIDYSPMMPDPPSSMSNEWAGLIGNSKDEMMIAAKWIMAAPLGAFMITAMAISLMVSGMRDTMLRRQVAKESIIEQKTKAFYAEKMLPVLHKLDVSNYSKKAKVALSSSLVVILVIGAGTYIYIKNKPEPLSAETLAKIEAFTPAPEKVQNKAYYDINIAAKDKPTGSYDVTAKVKVENLSEQKWDQLLFYMLPNLFIKENLEELKKKAGFFGRNFEYPSEFALKSVLLNGKPVEYSLEMQKLTIPLSEGLEPTKAVDLEFVYSFTLPPNSYIFGLYNRMSLFGQFYPMLAVYNDEGWQFRDFTPYTDDYYLNPADFKVTYKMKDAGLIATSDNVFTGKEKEGVIEAKNVKEFFMVGHDYNRVKEETIDGVKVRVFGTTREIRQMNQALELVAEALPFFEKKLGQPYPRKQLDIVVSWSTESRPGFFFAKDWGEGQEVFKQNVLKEIAEQWVDLVRNDPYQEAWLDQGVSEFLAGLYAVEKQGQKPNIVFAAPTVDMPKQPANTSVAEINSGDEPMFVNPDLVLRTKPSNGLWKYFEKNGGADAAFDFLKAYFETYGGKEISSEEFVKFFRAENKLTTNEAFKDWLDLGKLNLDGVEAK